MGCIIAALYIFAMIYVIATWIEFSRAFVLGISLRARYDMMYSSVLWEIVGSTATALNLIIADCTIVRVACPYRDYYSKCELPFRSGIVGLCGLTIGE